MLDGRPDCSARVVNVKNSPTGQDGGKSIFVRAGASQAECPEEDAVMRRPSVRPAYISSCSEGPLPPRRATPLPPSNGTVISSAGQILMASECVEP